MSKIDDYIEAEKHCKRILHKVLKLQSHPEHYKKKRYKNGKNNTKYTQRNLNPSPKC